MKFCTKCDNMLYLHIDENEPDKLMHFCQKCGNKQKIKIKNNMDDQEKDVQDYCIYKEHIQETAKFENFVNKYTKYDPTLPSMKNIKCPNVDCPSVKVEDTGDNVLYLRYDDENMKYLFMCKTCDNAWTI